VNIILYYPCDTFKVCFCSGSGSIHSEVLAQDLVCPLLPDVFGDALSFVGENANIHLGFPFHISGAE
jgi:hypothetical protein